MIDAVERIGHSLIQHGPNSQRIYLMQSSMEDLPGLLDTLDEMVGRNGYTKIFAKVPVGQQDLFLLHGYRMEATVPCFFRGEEAGLFLGKYFSEDREREQQPALIKEILQKAAEKQQLISAAGNAQGSCRPLFSDDMPAAANLYRTVFASYPFPIHDPDYLCSTMDHIAYYGVWFDDRLVALASAELDRESANAEMTDFATLPEYQGKGFAGMLLDRMEQDMKDRRIGTLYTIARAYSYGMNITFAKNGYTYSGTLTNNTQIAGHLESMNVWYKLLPLE